MIDHEKYRALIDDEEYKALIEHLVHDGEFGKVPNWYFTLRAARYCKVSPWEMDDHPRWIAYAIAAEAAEMEAERKRGNRIAIRAGQVAKAAG